MREVTLSWEFHLLPRTSLMREYSLGSKFVIRTVLTSLVGIVLVGILVAPLQVVLKAITIVIAFFFFAQ